MRGETFKFAKASGDRVFLEFIYSRLVVKYNEPHNVDYILCLQDFAKGINECVKKANAYDRLVGDGTIRGDYFETF